jgi:hypothetical protein
MPQYKSVGNQKSDEHIFGIGKTAFLLSLNMKKQEIPICRFLYAKNSNLPN